MKAKSTAAGRLRSAECQALRVYLRDPAQLEAVRSVFDASGIPAQNIVYLHGEVCRHELAVELEGVFAPEGAKLVIVRSKRMAAARPMRRIRSLTRRIQGKSIWKTTFNGVVQDRGTVFRGRRRARPAHGQVADNHTMYRGCMHTSTCSAGCRWPCSALIYRQFPAMAGNTLAKAHFWLYNLASSGADGDPVHVPRRQRRHRAGVGHCIHAGRLANCAVCGECGE